MVILKRNILSQIDIYFILIPSVVLLFTCTHKKKSFNKDKTAPALYLPFGFPFDI